ncbi:DnaJ family domain-containing protein [Arthrobacter russicus]|jgi:hypothetical protein|uniref:DnaJ homologue subfamily C member 28 conserved domain-containing protein n=1 Tax=Arthrobacter russicus TaxID=172040 RepID=A0ABU1JAH3_9MICC|nr:DUF1992 domain-containing protein [Arthrobacter russicus]MDR6269418.1 hypothetical protein [Arthrobacter russicus]
MPQQDMNEFDNPVTRAARYRASQEAQAESGAPAEAEIPPFRPDDVAARADAAVDLAVARGDFDNLAYAGKPLPAMGANLDPDWWVQGLIQREQLTGLGPPAIMLRKEDAELDAELDKLPTEGQVRELLEDFNARVVDARRQLLGGPPVVTKVRDIEQEILRWRARRAAANPSPVPATGRSRRKTGPGIWARWFRREKLPGRFH